MVLAISEADAAIIIALITTGLAGFFGVITTIINKKLGKSNGSGNVSQMLEKVLAEQTRHGTILAEHIIQNTKEHIFVRDKLERDLSEIRDWIKVHEHFHTTQAGDGK